MTEERLTEFSRVVNYYAAVDWMGGWVPSRETATATKTSSRHKNGRKSPQMCCACVSFAVAALLAGVGVGVGVGCQSPKNATPNTAVWYI